MDESQRVSNFFKKFPSLKGKECSPLVWRRYELDEKDTFAAELNKNQILNTITQSKKIVEYDVFCLPDIEKYLIDRQNLREEGIGDIKKLRKQKKDIKAEIVFHPNIDQIVIIGEVEDYIKWKFNITEKDLK